MTTFRYRDIAPQRLQAPEGCTLSTAGTLPAPQDAPIRIHGWTLWPHILLGLVVYSLSLSAQTPAASVCPSALTEAQPKILRSPPPTNCLTSGANLLRSRGRLSRYDWLGCKGGGAEALERFRAPGPAACLAAAVTSWRLGLRRQREEEAAVLRRLLRADRANRDVVPRRRSVEGTPSLWLNRGNDWVTLFGVHLFTYPLYL